MQPRKKLNVITFMAVLTSSLGSLLVSLLGDLPGSFPCFFLIILQLVCQVPGAVASADDSSNTSTPYIFGGKCASQGPWTAQALGQTTEIMDIAKRLKNDARCGKLADGFMNAVPQLQASITSAQNDQNAVSRLQSLTQQMTSLAEFSTSSTPNKIDVVKMLLDRDVQYAAETAKMSASPMPGSQATDRNGQISQDIFSFSQRLSQTTNSSLDIFNSMIEQVADNAECPLNNNTGGQLFAASVNILSAFANSGQSSTGLKLSEAISKFFTAFRALKYARVIREGNETLLLNSVSCLIEMTSESYCSARDSRVLWDETQNQTQVQLSTKNQTLYLADKETASSAQGTPLTGFYLLTQQLPIVNEWLLKILIAVDPQLITDAIFRNAVLDNTNDFFKKVNDLRALYNNKIKTIQQYSDHESQVNATIDLISLLSTSILTSSERSSATNFFTQAILPLDMPFVLAGLPSPTEDIRAKGLQWDAGYWFQTHKNEIPALQDPNAFAARMRDNLDKIIASAQSSAIGYYNQWAIVDKQNVVDSSFLGINYNVNEILSATDKYLESLKNRLRAIIIREASQNVEHPIDPSILGSIQDTQMRVRKILAQLDVVRKTSIEFSLAGSVSNVTNNDPSLVAKQVAFEVASRDFLITLYEQLNVILSRTGFLSNRMAVYVQYDFQATLRDQENAGSLFSDAKFEQALKFATNMAAYNQLLAITGGNPASVRQDIDNAMIIQKENIQMIESIFKDFFARKIAEDHLRHTHPDAGAQTIDADANIRNFHDHLDTVPTEGRTGVETGIDKVTGSFGAFFNIFGSQNRYSYGGITTPLDRSTVLSSDTEFGSAEEMYAQYCIQALAFTDLRGIDYECRGAVLHSPFNAPTDPAAKKAFDSYLNVSFDEKSMENFTTNRPLNESNRICALRDYYRRNQVLYLTKGMSDDAPTLQTTEK